MVAVFPTFRGLMFPITRTRIGRTVVANSWSGKRTAIGVMSYPLYQYDVSMSVLAAVNPFDYQTLLGFYNQMNGPFLDFYYTDQYDNTATTQTFGTGDGVTTKFQLSRSLGGFSEPVQSPITYALFDNGGAAGAFTLGAGGVVTFSSPPAAGHVLTWTGTYYWLCYFTQDQQAFDQFDAYRYEVKKLTFMTDKI